MFKPAVGSFDNNHGVLNSETTMFSITCASFDNPLNICKDDTGLLGRELPGFGQTNKSSASVGMVTKFVESDVIAGGRPCLALMNLEVNDFHRLKYLSSQ